MCNVLMWQPFPWCESFNGTLVYPRGWWAISLITAPSHQLTPSITVTLGAVSVPRAGAAECQASPRFVMAKVSKGSRRRRAAGGRGRT